MPRFPHCTNFLALALSFCTCAARRTVLGAAACSLRHAKLVGQAMQKMDGRLLLMFAGARAGAGKGRGMMPQVLLLAQCHAANFTACVHICNSCNTRLLYRPTGRSWRRRGSAASTALLSGFPSFLSVHYPQCCICPVSQAYGRELAEAGEWCRKYSDSRKDSDLHQAWDL